MQAKLAGMPVYIDCFFLANRMSCHLATQYGHGAFQLELNTSHWKEGESVGRLFTEILQFYITNSIKKRETLSLDMRKNSACKTMGVGIFAL